MSVHVNEWESIGTIVGDASTAEFTFILRSYRSRVGDIVAVPMQIPNDTYSGLHDIIAWGRLIAIERYNPFFPHEAAHELANESIPLIDTVLSSTRDQLQAQVLVLGFTPATSLTHLELYPLTYPIPPAADVRYPTADAIKSLLAGTLRNQTPLRIGSLIARSDVTIDVAAERVVARHLAVLAMTGGGKTVAARRVLRELIDKGYPLLIFDPHGDYLGLWEKRHLFPDTDVRLFFPQIVMTGENGRIVDTLIKKMTEALTPPQQEFMDWLLLQCEPQAGQSVRDYISTLTRLARTCQAGNGPPNPPRAQAATINAVRRTLQYVHDNLQKMEKTNGRLRAVFRDLAFDAMPDPEGSPEAIIRPRQVSILYLGGYDHLTQSTIVSILMEALFAHRAELADRIAPFLAVVEEAHNFIPSIREGIEETPSLPTLRKVITEGRKFGVGLMLITQRPSRVDETILAQCNSFLVMRLVNPKDQTYVRSVMENLPESDARLLSGFGPGQGIISGQAVRFPLLVKIDFDADLVGSRTSDEDFITAARNWKPDPRAESRARAGKGAERLAKKAKRLRPR